MSPDGDSARTSGNLPTPFHEAKMAYNFLAYNANKRSMTLAINTPAGQSPRADEVKIRTTAVYTGTPIMTTMSGAKAAALGIAALRKSGYAPRTLQEYH